SCDLDLWLAPEDVWRAAEALRERGYVWRGAFTPRQRRALVRCGSELGLTRPDGPTIELQWQLLPRLAPRPPGREPLWRRRRMVTLSPAAVPAMAPEETLLCLAVHGVKHLWPTLRMILDLALLLEAERDLDWDRTLTLAETLRLRRILLLGVALAREL